MQYLSRAYNYYSGINPATLTGAIDVIVVRHVDDNGDVTLSGSPFHVRFGKLQVIRAGEKRVTVRLPNNLPAPHVAPFSMKVGETGEAFFVLETDEEVPEELITSPVVMPAATEPDILQAPDDRIDSSSGASLDAGTSLTQQPFGATEQQTVTATALDEVDFLDLNAPVVSSSPQPEHNASSVLDTAASYMPSIPFIGQKVDQKVETRGDMHASTPTPSPSADEGNRLPPNPLEAKPGESTRLPSRDHRLSEVATPQQSPDIDPADTLPKVAPGHGEAPDVKYGKDVVMDTTGYHQSGRHTIRPPVTIPDVRDSVLDTFTCDLEAALPDHHRPSLALRATEPDVQAWDVRISDVDQLYTRSPSPARHERATSEPPPDASEPASPRLDASKTAIAMDYAWDWGRLPENGHEDTTGSQELRRPAHRGLTSPHDHRPLGAPKARMKGVEENPYLFVLEFDARAHTFEIALCPDLPAEGTPDVDLVREATFLESRVTFQRFIEEAQVVDDPDLVIRYSLRYSTWSNNQRLLSALAQYRRELGVTGGPIGLLPSLGELGVDAAPTAGYGWSKWWRRSQTANTGSSSPPSSAANLPTSAPSTETHGTKHYAKTLRLSSDQLKQLDLKLGPNTVQFSVTSSYSGVAMCSARIFLWDSTDQIVISDIDGTITKSDALGHVYAAIGRDWTHLGIAKLYTDITNNGYRMLYLTSRAIGQADSTRGYLKSIVQGDYRLPEGPVIMSPDRLMASLHREVIMRKPELFKMACLRDIQRLFLGHAQEAFFAGFGNRITDAMSYRSVGIPAAKIYTIDSTGVVKTELLQAAGHKGSYIQLNDLVNEVFPPMSTKFKPEYTDFNYWRAAIADVDLPDLTPPSPALSVRSDTSGRLSVLGKITGLGRRTSRQPILPTLNPSSRPSSPLMAPALSSDNLSEPYRQAGSMPGSYEDKGGNFPERLRSAADAEPHDEEVDVEAADDNKEENYDYEDDDIFDDDLLATGEMRNVPF